jgi:hypothetical protein
MPPPPGKPPGTKKFSGKKYAKMYRLANENRQNLIANIKFNPNPGGGIKTYAYVLNNPMGSIDV